MLPSIKDELKSDNQSLMQGLRDELADNQRLTQRLKDELIDSGAENQRLIQELRAELKVDSQRLEGFIASKTTGQHEIREGLLEDIAATMREQVNASNKVFKATINQLRAELKAEEEEIQRDLETLKTAMTKALAPGETGYLAPYCLLLLGWDGEEYACYSYRAATFYIDFLGLPPEGVGADEEAF
ncbi:hypothetical protein F5B21DRAFT_510323 [Xylaria acuta]|nr:hypothetical protein F5B21DRAFT_510323 [Xylaria acuta]